jgi:LysM repeat protein
MFHRNDPPVRLRRPLRGGMLHQMHAKMNRLPAHLTREDDWNEEQPGVRLSRVFGVVLGIHVVAIGGLMAYEMFRHREPAVAAGSTTLRPAVREARPAVPGAGSERVADSFADDPMHDGLLKHVVAPGERLAEIAARYGVDEKALTAKNRIGDHRPFASGMKLVIPNRQLQAAAPVVAPAPLSGAGTPLSGAAAVASALPAYDPTRPTLRAEPVDEPAVAPKPVPRAERAAKPPARKPAEVASARKPSEVAAVSKKPAAPAAKAETAAAKPKAKGRVHVVREGDTAYRIAKAYGVNLDQLIKTNGINPNTLRPGTSLTIPPAPR